MTSSLRIIVTGLVGLYPVGGVAWDYLQYLIGLTRLGHDVYYHEDTWSWPYHPIERTYTSEGTYSATYIDNFFNRYAPQLREKWHYLHLHEISFGMERAAFDEIARTADLFLNISGACMIPDNLSPQCLKVFLDTDPGYNQIVLSERFSWSENVERWCTNVAAHDCHFTYAENIYGAECTIPKVGINWKTTRMPIVIDLWTPLVGAEQPNLLPWTTVMTWNAFKGKLIYKGVEYKSKGNEFDKVIKLPQATEVPFKIAVGGMKAPLKRLADYGWQVVDGPQATLTPPRYQEFIAQSRGEFSVAKHVYAATQSGWFSCRSACYLAAGRPVVVQDTGFSAILPVGEGILPFVTPEEAVRAISEVESCYKRHEIAARSLAKEYFDSDKVLTHLVDQAIGSSKTDLKKNSEPHSPLHREN
ncbi:MAG: hypothetical protein WA919_14520 [Coleofasciculaceae cyanobacterium]